jgi:hypothetical protein
VPIDNDLNQVLKGITGNLNLLNKFLNDIRGGGKEVDSAKADKSFQARDEEGANVEPLLYQRSLHSIHDRFPGANDTLRKRLARTPVLRRKRALCWRARY